MEEEDPPSSKVRHLTLRCITLQNHPMSSHNQSIQPNHYLHNQKNKATPMFASLITRFMLKLRHLQLIHHSKFSPWLRKCVSLWIKQHSKTILICRFWPPLELIGLGKCCICWGKVIFQTHMLLTYGICWSAGQSFCHLVQTK